MITKNHLIYEVLSFESSGSLPNSMTISPELAYEWIVETRSKLIGQSLNNKDQINDSFIQYIPSVDLIQTDSSTCCDVNSGCLLLKSVQKIPSTIDTFRDNWLVSVVTPLGQNINKTNPIKQRYSKFNKFTKNIKQWFIKDDYLYIINDILLDKVSVSGLFEFPEDVARFTCSGTPCFDDDSDYPVSTTMASQIISIIIKEKLTPFLQMPSDVSNDNNGQNAKQVSDNKNAGV